MAPAFPRGLLERKRKARETEKGLEKTGKKKTCLEVGGEPGGGTKREKDWKKKNIITNND